MTEELRQRQTSASESALEAALGPFPPLEALSATPGPLATCIYHFVLSCFPPKQGLSAGKDSCCHPYLLSSISAVQASLAPDARFTVPFLSY